MHIRELDLDNEGELHDFYAIYRDAWQAGALDRPTWPEPEMLAHFTAPADDEIPLGLVAFEKSTESRMVGVAFMFYPVLDNLTKAYTGVYVAPAERGRGIGGELLEVVVNRAGADGRPVILAESIYGFDRREDHPNRRFAEHRGFSVASTEVCRRLDLPVADGLLEGWIAEAAPYHTEYRIETFTGDIPEDLLPSVCHVVNQLALDAPTGDIDMEAEQVTPEVWHQHVERGVKHGQVRHDTVAIDATGTAVAVTTLAISAADPGRMQQWATIVAREHRGHRLGLAVKAQNLRTAQRRHPDCTAVYTCNEESNGPMVDINERMGFKPLELMVEFQRKLDV